MIRKDQRAKVFENKDVNSSEKDNLDILKLFPQKDARDDKMHLAVLYASPLGYEVPDGMGSKAFKVIQELDFQGDVSNITNALKGGKNKVNYSIRMGTSMNFISSISKSPYVLHFIGHGISNHESYGK